MAEIGQVPPQVEGFDGSELKKFVENPSSFNKYVDKTFKSLDADHKGTLSPKELTPIMGTIGEALGLPPKGTDQESDHIYDEVDIVLFQFHVAWGVSWLRSLLWFSSSKQVRGKYSFCSLGVLLLTS